MFVSIIKYVAAFLLGRYSYLYFRNRYLEEKKEQLIGYRDALLEIEKGLEEKDEAIRRKWQKMVTDISKYDMAMRPDSGKWTEADDVYFNSWNSAEQ